MLIWCLDSIDCTSITSWIDFSHCHLLTYLGNDLNEWQNEQINGTSESKWAKMSKNPGLGGPLGGLCNILFPKKYIRKNTCIKAFPTEWDIK